MVLCSGQGKLQSWSTPSCPIELTKKDSEHITLLEAQKPTRNPEILKNTEFTRTFFSEKFARTFASFPV